MKNAIDDIKTLRNWVIGIAGFATTISAILIQVFHFRAEPTITAVVGFACALILIVFLIQRSEDRTSKMLQDHIGTSDKRMDEISNTLNEIKDITIGNQMASLRIEMGNEIKRRPENHDTILKLAEKYFIELGGNWVATDTFFEWAEREKEAGRVVYMPSALMNNIQTKRLAETK